MLCRTSKSVALLASAVFCFDTDLRSEVVSPPDEVLKRFDITEKETFRIVIPSPNAKKHHPRFVDVPRSAARAYRELTDVPRDLAFYTMEEWANNITAFEPKIAELAQQITKGLSTTEERAEALRSFCFRSIEYDAEYSRRFAFPLELLQRGRGACGDKAFLFASLCRSVKIECALVCWWESEEPGKRHALCAVPGNFSGYYYLSDDNRRFYLADPTFAAPIGKRKPHEGGRGAMVLFSGRSPSSIEEIRANAQKKGFASWPIFRDYLARRPFNDASPSKRYRSQSTKGVTSQQSRDFSRRSLATRSDR